jgi:hypothetical protein
MNVRAFLADMMNFIDFMPGQGGNDANDARLY